jgi:hypothetical protein
LAIQRSDPTQITRGPRNYRDRNRQKSTPISTTQGSCKRSMRREIREDEEEESKTIQDVSRIELEQDSKQALDVDRRSSIIAEECYNHSGPNENHSDKSSRGLGVQTDRTELIDSSVISKVWSSQNRDRSVSSKLRTEPVQS